MLTELALLGYGIDATRKANLIKLAAYLREVDNTQFDMSTFYQRQDEHFGLVTCCVADVLQYATERNYCGTVACAIGCGPAAGMPLIDTDKGWMTYSHRVFVNCEHTWDFLFSDGWTRIDNSPGGAATRIEFLLEHGLKAIWPTNMDTYELFDKIEKDGIPY